MDIKTRLEDDTILFADFNNNTSRTNVLTSLNNVGVYTVEDLINADASIFPAQSRKLYTAMAHVFRKAYLNQDLVYDVLFQKEYEVKKIGYSNESELPNDLLRLGVIKGTIQTIKYHLLFDLGLSEGYPNPTVTIEYLLREKGMNASGPNLRRFYLNYIDEKKKLEQSSNEQIIPESNVENVDSSSLTSLKVQLQTLIAMKQGLEKQIDTLQNQIATLEGGSINNGRK